MNIKCKLCGEVKVKIRTRKRKNNFFYRDVEGGRWDRNFCPDCTNPPEAEFDADPITHRLCKQCGVNLPTSRYLRCVSCATPSVNSEHSRNYDFWSGEEYGYTVHLASGNS